MKKISRLLCLALCICMVLTMALTGCTEKTPTQDTTGDKSTAADTSAPVEATELAPYEVTWYLAGNGAEPNEKMIEKAMGEYLKDKINTTVDIVTYSIGEYQDKVRTIIQSGEKCDLFFTCSWLMDYIQTARDGFEIEITDEMLTKYAPHAKEVLSGAFIDGVKIDGKLYNLACNKEVGAQGGVLLNKAMVEQYGIDTTKITKYADLFDVLQTIKQKAPADVIPIDTCRVNNAGTIADMFANSVGQAFAYIKYSTKDSKWVTVFDIPEIVDLYRTSQKMYKAGIIRKDAPTINDNMPDLKSGKVFATIAQLKPGKDAEMTGSTGVEWMQVPLTDAVSRSGDVTGSMVGISKTCADPGRVLTFYDYFYHDKDLLTLMNRGIENVHWVKADVENVIDYAPVTENGAKSGWKPPFYTWMVGDQFLNYIFKGEDTKKYETMKAFNATCKPFDSVGFLFDNTNCKNMTDKLEAAQANEYSLLNMGVVEDVDATMKKQLDIWNEAGLQDVLAEYNKQYEAWKALK